MLRSGEVFNQETLVEFCGVLLDSSDYTINAAGTQLVFNISFEVGDSYTIIIDGPDGAGGGTIVGETTTTVTSTNQDVSVTAPISAVTASSVDNGVIASSTIQQVSVSESGASVDVNNTIQEVTAVSPNSNVEVAIVGPNGIDSALRQLILDSTDFNDLQNRLR